MSDGVDGATPSPGWVSDPSYAPARASYVAAKQAAMDAVADAETAQDRTAAQQALETFKANNPQPVSSVLEDNTQAIHEWYKQLVSDTVPVSIRDLSAFLELDGPGDTMGNIITMSEQPKPPMPVAPTPTGDTATDDAATAAYNNAMGSYAAQVSPIVACQKVVRILNKFEVIDINDPRVQPVLDNLVSANVGLVEADITNIKNMGIVQVELWRKLKHRKAPPPDVINMARP